jgi:hypothetical protein
MTTKVPKGLPIIGSFTTVKALSWQLVGLINSGLKGRRWIAGFEAAGEPEGVLVVVLNGDSI